MLKIGDFSRVAHVTVKALRLYGQMGLLRPAWVDRFSGYRYYSLSQLPQLNRILALKELGFSLDQVANMLDRRLEADELRSILSQKRSELEGRLAAEQARLAQVEARLLHLEQMGSLPGYEVLLKGLPDQKVVSARDVVSTLDRLPARKDALRQQLMEYLQGHGMRPTGTWMSVIHNAEYTERNIQLEVACEVDLAAGGGKKSRLKLVHTLPAVAKMACLVHTGARVDLTEAYAALYAWLEANGYHQSGPVREVCHADPEEKSTACAVFELQMPVEKPSLRGKSIGQVEKEIRMELKLVEKPAIMLVGMKYVGKNQHNEIGEMWGRFNPHISSLVHEPFDAAYGVCTMVPGLEEGAFEYIACVPISKAENLPDWAVVKMIPANTYAVFEHRGTHASLKDTYHNIYQVWLPQLGYEPSADYDMEVYTDEFKNFAPDSVMYIYVPVKKK